MARTLHVNEALDFLRHTLSHSTSSQGHAIRVFGSPRSGKTQLALALFVDRANIPRVREGRSVLLVSHRKQADQLNSVVLHIVGASRQERPVKTISALAFSLLAADRARRGLVPPKLMDGAEQDRLITEILNGHLEHMKRGDDCHTCDLFRAYLAVGRAHPTGLARAVTAQDAGSSAQTSDQIFQRVITPQFVAQIRDIFARLDELDLSGDGEPADRMQKIESDSRIGDAVWTLEAWSLARALKKEYEEKIATGSSSFHKLDPAALLVQARLVVDHVTCPELVIMDDCQDLTLAGFELLLALQKAGTDIVMIGCDDESVQGFRGAAPEVCTALETSKSVMGATTCELADGLDDGQHTYRARVCRRISDAIGSAIVRNNLPVPDRPGKLHTSAEGESDQPPADRSSLDTSLEVRIFRTPQEETDDLMYRIMRTAMQLRKDHDSDIYSSMAVIAHDNSTLRSVGRKLENAGIPVSYVSSTVALKQSPVVQGLLGMLRLVQLVRSAQSHHTVSAQDGERLCELLLAAVGGPLFCAVPSSGNERPVRVSKIVAGLTSISRVSSLREATPQCTTICDEWNKFTHGTYGDAESQSQQGPEQTASHRAISPDGIAVLLLIGSEDVRKTIASLLDAVMYTRQHTPNASANDQEQAGQEQADQISDPDLSALLHCCEVVRSVAQQKVTGSSSSLIPVPYAQLWKVWDACGVANRWADQALGSGTQAQLANNRLDTVIRLFAYAQNAPLDEDIDAFIDRIENLDIEADSLARQAPKDETVTLTTPAGASMLQKKYVWVIGVQDGVWPNLAPRDSLFGAQMLTLIAFAHRLEAHGIDSAIGPTRRDLVLAQNTALEYSEEQSFLVALTRASQKTVVSAVWSDEVMPSPFLPLFMPEQISRDQRSYASVGDQEPMDQENSNNAQLRHMLSGHDASLQGMAVACRTILTHHIAQQKPDDRYVEDASSALAFLAHVGIREADPQSWGFTENQQENPSPQPQSSPQREKRIPIVNLSPSNVDAIWKCPLRWSMERRFGGPSLSNASMQFGTLVHETLQWVTDQKYDRTVDDEKKLAHLLITHAREEIAQQPRFRDVENVYRLHQRVSEVRTIFAHAAHYFIASRNPLYPSRKVKNTVPPSGKLDDVAAEVPFTSDFSLSVLEAIIRNTPGLAPVRAAELYAVLSDIAGGFSDDFDPHTRIMLSARIDRLEKRIQDGQNVLDIIDWKTGSQPSGADRFSDLQLICYQLGVALGDACRTAFPGQDLSRAHVDRALLFHLAHEADPQTNYYPETAYQPALLERAKRAEHPEHVARPGQWKLTTHFRPRSHYKSLDKLFVAPHVREGEKLTDSMKGENSQALWGLTMFSRLMYAASYVHSSFYPAKRDTQYCSSCPFKPICPAWQDSATIYGPLTTNSVSSARPARAHATSQEDAS